MEYFHWEDNLKMGICPGIYPKAFINTYKLGIYGITCIIRDLYGSNYFWGLN